MSEWGDYDLGRLVQSISETYRFRRDEQVIFLNTSDILLGKVLHENLSFPSILPGQAKKRIQKGDFLFSEIRPANGRYALIDFDADKYVVSTKLMVLRGGPKIHPKFFQLLLTSKEVLEHLQLIAEDRSGTFPQITFDNIASIKVSLPSLAEQQAIAEVLSSLDDKIDLLHRQNKTLESLAEIVFRRWFIDGAQDNWEEKPLKDICIIRNGYAFKSETYETDGQKIIRTMNFKSGYVEEKSLVFVSDELAKTFSSFWLKRSDFLLVMVGASLGNFAIVTSDVLPALQNQNMWCFRAMCEGMQHYLNYALRSIIAENLHGASGSARSFFQKGAFYELLMKVPSEDLISDFNEYSEGIFSKIEFNRGQIKGLEKLRDTLLPKLMSGEVRVDYEAAA